MADRDLVRTDAEISRERGMIEVERLEAEVEQLREELASETQNRGLRLPIAVAALALMVFQIIASNSIFVW